MVTFVVLWIGSVYGNVQYGPEGGKTGEGSLLDDEIIQLSGNADLD